MHLAGLLLSGSLLFAPPAESHEAVPAATQAVFDRVAKMSPAEQQQWLRDLEQRAIRAGRLALPPDETAKHEARVKKLLYQQIVSWKSLRAVIEETDRLEYLRQSIARHVPERTQSLPVPTVVDVQRVLPRMPEAPRLPPLLSQAKTARPTDDMSRLLATSTVRRAVNLPQMAANVPGASIGRHPASRPSIETVSALAGAVASDGPESSPAEPAAMSQPAAVVGILPKPQPFSADEPASGGTSPQPSPLARPRKPTADQPAMADELTLSSHSRAAHTFTAALPKVESEPTRPVEPVILPTETQVVPPMTSHADESSESADELPAGSVRVDVAGLATRIAGCNLALRTVEAELDEKGPWNALRLGPMLDRIKILTIRRNDLNLFREAVSEEQRASLKRLESPKGLISQFAARIFEARTHATGPDFKGSDAKRQAELQRLEELSRGLAELAGK